MPFFRNVHKYKASFNHIYKCEHIENIVCMCGHRCKECVHACVCESECAHVDEFVLLRGKEMWTASEFTEQC